MKRWLLVLLLHCSVWGDPLPSAAPEKMGMDGKVLGRIQGVVEEAIAAGKTPGAVVLVGRREHIVYRRAFGQRSLEPVREAMQAGETPEQIEKSWQAGLESFKLRRKPYLLYP